MAHPKRTFTLPYNPSVGGVAPEVDPALRMYVIVNRPVLTVVQSGVQGAHAIAEYSAIHKDCEKYSKWASKDKTLIFLQSDRRTMDTTVEGLAKVGKKYAKFIEPDMYDVDMDYVSKDIAALGTFTALAVEPMTPIEGKLYFGAFELLK